MAPPSKKFKPTTPEQMLKLKVISVRETKRVQDWTIKKDVAIPESTHTNSVAAVSDGHAAYRFVLFKELAAEVAAGNSYIIKNYNNAKFGSPTFLCTHQTKIYNCAAITVPEELEEEARRMLSPPSPCVKLSTITVPSQCITVEGSVTHLDSFQAISPPQGQPYPLRVLHLKEADTEMRVMMWREANIAQLEVGMPIKLSHMRAKNVPPYGFGLHSTSHTEVQLFSGLMDIEVLGVRDTGEEIEILDTDETPRVIAASVWAASLSEPPVTAVGKKMTLCYTDGRVQEVFSVFD